MTVLYAAVLCLHGGHFSGSKGLSVMRLSYLYQRVLRRAGSESAAWCEQLRLEGLLKQPEHIAWCLMPQKAGKHVSTIVASCMLQSDSAAMAYQDSLAVSASESC